MSKDRYFIGLISGTSADGVDAALTSILRLSRGAIRVRLHAFLTFSYPPGLRQRILGTSHGRQTSLEDLASLHMELGEVFSQAAIRLARKAKVDLSSVSAIGSHGQTLFHGPRPGKASGLRPATLQLANPSIIAARTGCTVVADFRTADIAAGGEGAPLSPHGHALLFRHPRQGRIILNLGGIANISAIPPGPKGRCPSDTQAFDTGPGNMVIDALVENLSGGRSSIDKGGLIAARGQADEDILKALLKHPYFHLRPPKSTGRETFGQAFALKLLRKVKRQGGSAEDALATACALTARSIANQLKRFVLKKNRYKELYLAGGGAKNKTLVRMIRQELTDLDIQPVDILGIPAKALEAVIFALLAAETMDARPVWLPLATGAKRPTILGTITPSPETKQLRLKTYL